jgi:hypothetical protein
METGDATLEAALLKMAKKLLSGDTVRIVANGCGYGIVATFQTDTD